MAAGDKAAQHTGGSAVFSGMANLSALPDRSDFGVRRNRGLLAGVDVCDGAGAYATRIIPGRHQFAAGYAHRPRAGDSFVKRFQGGVTWARLRVQHGAARVRDAVRRRSRKALIAAAAMGLALGLVGVGVVGIGIFAGLPAVPNAEALWAYNRPGQGVTFLDAKGAILGVRGPFYGRQVRLSDLPPYVPQAFLAIEDQRFYEHGGFDEKALARAAAANLSAGETVQGGSTITQQLVKNLFLTPERTIRRKLQEIALASRVERKLSKDEILELYLNRVYLGEQAYGVDAAAQRYFGRPAARLSLAQAALLAGLPKAPSSYAPTTNLDRAKARQKLVLAAMTEVGAITTAQAEQALAEPLSIKARRGEPDGLGYVFDAAMDEVQALGGELPPDAVVQLSIEPRLQAAAARAVRQGLGKRAGGKAPLQAALISIAPDGAIPALIGGADYQASKFNRATQAKRQPGSTFKAFVYTAAIEAGLTPDTVRFDEPIEIDGWKPANYEQGSYRGAVTLRTAMALSLNTVAAAVAEEIGQERVVEVAQRLGLSAKMEPYPSIALGVTQATPLEMTQAFSIYMRNGKAVSPFLVRSVADSRGAALFVRRPAAAVPVLDERTALAMNNMLGRVVRSGTGTAARLDRDVAGKTGTSENYRDAWFVGYTAELTAGVWIGRDDDKPTGRITGGTLPAMIWAGFMREAVKDTPPQPLPGIEDAPPTPQEEELAAFYQMLRDVLRTPAPTPRRLTQTAAEGQQPDNLVR